MTLTADIATALRYTEILNDEGEPMMVYHYTNVDFDRFDASYLGKNTDNNACDDSWAATAHVGFWFNVDGDFSKLDSRRMECYLNIQNPYHIGCVDYLAQCLAVESAEDFRKRLIDEGYDGIVVDYDEEFGGTSFVAFSADQIIIIK